ncbi:hypothetical protein GLOIN_2v1776455 [Rhizophagus irregularis DAOM 181602=DAOM 197198]|nr:hypothetical protein GLOIN_2v1776455 [Rhizophagus irregularis DAOM 181602=DAOM 197198]
MCDASSHQANAKLTQIIKEKGIILGFVLDPLRKAVLSLESRRATLADCFLSLARLAATLKKLPKSLNPAFRSHCIKI